MVITHCGHGATLKALSAGIPLLCLPMGRDQDDTAARVVYRGAGVRLSSKASASAIARAVERVLGDEKYRTAAGRLRDEIETECSQIDLAVELERHASVS